MRNLFFIHALPISIEWNLHLNPQQYSAIIRIWKTEYGGGLYFNSDVVRLQNAISCDMLYCDEYIVLTDCLCYRWRHDGKCVYAVRPLQYQKLGETAWIR